MSEPDFIVPPPGLVPDEPEPEAGETPDGTVRASRRLPAFRPVGSVPPAVDRIAPPPSAVPSALPLPPGPPAPPAAPPDEPPPAERSAAAPAPSFPPVAPVAPVSGAGARPPAFAPARIAGPDPSGPVPPSADSARAWRLRTADGVEFTVRSRAVVGRDPLPSAVHGGGTPVAVPDPARSMSKTHALLEVEGDRLLVTDLRSTNGVRIWPEGGDAIELRPGAPTPVPLDAVLLLGDVAFLVDLVPGTGS
ncbi:FHA domain-containing protein [Agromyces aurantiacus]|uniref:FHA domain-containing protein n=1 Tax=Agromyces aurantiacus TaxID=165814 RepID=A0ABV9R897_9MICO|nr:FHA domain-containing protein [Agromyces aurantiacus]MBM7505087.1 hypothetical protein [Agromyces aurantiacus]